ncbi:MAG: M24 family metallopeptidase, partial [Pseudomonadota bacterium]
SLGFESRNITVAALRDFEKECACQKLLPQADELENLRAVKDAEELGILKQAAQIATESLRRAVVLIRPGIREIDIAVELEYQMRKRGGAAAAFQSIVASGYRSALPHGVASQKKIKRGEFLTIDFGTIYQGYCSDETCTFVIGEPTKKQKRIYETVKKAHDLALSSAAPGKYFKDIDAAARKYIARQGYARYFNHGTGHGIGLCVHEPPTVSFRSKAKVKKGMVFTIEPGIYLPSWGGVRIEDTVVAISRGCEVITKSDKNLQSVGI